MGTWSDPLHDLGKARELREILLSDNRLTAKRAEEYLYPIVGDDGFFDLLASDECRASGFDTRPYAAAWVKGWLNDGEERWTKPWDPDAVRIVRETLDEFERRHPGAVVLPAAFQVYFDTPPAPAVF